MKSTSDILTVTFDSSLDDEAGICVSRIVNGKVVVLKMELGEQADILYHLLTEQMAKAEIKAESEDREIKSKSFNDYQEAFIFNDKVNGQIQWCSYKHKKYWIVWY